MQVVNILEYKSDEVMNKILFHFVVFFPLFTSTVALESESSLRRV